MLLAAADEPASPVKHDSQPVMDWIQHLAPQSEDHEMAPAPELGSGVEAHAPTMDGLEDQPEAETAGADVVMRSSPPPALPITGLPSHTDPALAGSVVDAVSDQATACALQKAGFDTKDDAVAWLGADCYLKAKTALCLLGVRCSSDVALLQSEQVKGVVGIKPIPRRKLFLILDKVVSDGDRIQWVFERYQPWLEENLGMAKAGMSQLAHYSFHLTLACVVPYETPRPSQQSNKLSQRVPCWPEVFYKVHMRSWLSPA